MVFWSTEVAVLNCLVLEGGGCWGRRGMSCVFFWFFLCFFLGGGRNKWCFFTGWGRELNWHHPELDFARFWPQSKSYKMDESNLLPGNIHYATGEGMKQNKICWKTSTGIDTSGSSFSMFFRRPRVSRPTQPCLLKAWIRSKSHGFPMGPGFEKDFSTWILCGLISLSKEKNIYILYI